MATHLTIRQAAEQLQCSPKTIRSAVKSGRIQAIKPGPRVIRIPSSALEAFNSSTHEEG